MSLSLRWLETVSLPVDGSPLCPEQFRNRSAREASRLRLRVGNGTAELGELFQVTGKTGDDCLTVEGNLGHVRGLGRGMSAGRLVVDGDAGLLLGAEMTGGRIEVVGSVGDWAGAELRGGMLVIRGNAGSFLGAALPGSRIGMREGVILVSGSAGDDAGSLMRRGLIAVRGNAGIGVGRGIIAGTILVLGTVLAAAGAGMKRGTLVLPSLDRDPEDVLLPSFARAGRFPAPFLTICYRQLEQWGFAVPGNISSAVLERYNGDRVVNGQGEVLVAQRSEG